MRQQINLYQAVLIDKPESLPFRQASLLLLAFLLLLTLLSLLGFWQMRGVGQRLAALKQQQVSLAEEIAVLERQYPERQKNALLEQEVERTRNLLEGQKQLLGYFAKQEEGENDGILRVLEGLARHHKAGVWLRRIRLNGSGDNITLAGSALEPEQVPQYLKYLGQNGVLNGQLFSRLKLTGLRERPGQIDFTLESLTEQQQ